MKTVSVFYCLLYATWTEGAAINVEGLEGGEVSFQCSHKFASNNVKYLCKDPCKGSQDVLVSVRSGNTAQSGRISLEDSGDGVFTVTLSRLQLSDAGHYWCSVERTGMDTFTSVGLIVKEAVLNEMTTVMEPSSTWTYEKIFNLTQVTFGINTSMSTNLTGREKTPILTTSASNNTDEGSRDSSTGTVLYATLGAVFMLTILVVVKCCWMCRKNTKLQPQVCCNIREHVSADEREADCDYDDIGEEVQSTQKISERYSGTPHHTKEDPVPPESMAGECTVPIYENICRSKDIAGSRYSNANVKDEADISDVVYIKPLPYTVSETTGDDGSPATLTNTPASAQHSRSQSDSMGGRPRSLWFGLDSSGTI